MTNLNRPPNDSTCIPKRAPISISSGPAYDVGDTTVIISMTPTFIGSRTPTNFTSSSRRVSMSSKIAKFSTSAPSASMFKSAKSKCTIVENTISSSNSIILGKQHLPKIEVGYKSKSKGFKSISTDSPRLLPSSREIYQSVKSSHVERVIYDTGIKSKEISSLSRNIPKISLKSSNTLTGRINKVETPRWIQGVLVKDIGKF